MKPLAGCVRGTGCSETGAHLPGTQFPLWPTLEKRRLQSVQACAAERRGAGWRPPQSGGHGPCPPPREARRLLYSTQAKLGWASRGAAILGLPPCAQLRGPALDPGPPGPGRPRVPVLRGLGGACKGLQSGQSPVLAWLTAPLLRTLGETTASREACEMRDAGTAANGCSGRRAGAMATANGGLGRGPAAAAGRRASTQV